jgi:hypothetical protein
VALLVNDDVEQQLIILSFNKNTFAEVPISPISLTRQRKSKNKLN